MYCLKLLFNKLSVNIEAVLFLEFKLLVSALFFLLISFVANAQSISGIVKDQAGKPLAQVNIVLKGTDFGTTTMNDGSFIIAHIPKGEYKVIASHLGFLPKNQMVRITEKRNYYLEFILVFEALTMPEIVIEGVAERIPDMLNLPVRTKLLETSVLQQIPATSTSALLTGVSGVNVSSEFGIFSSSSVSLRGVGGASQSGTLVVLDGVPLNKTDGASVNWNIIDKDNIEKIEILKGPASALYGSNAMGGIINIISKKPVSRFQAKASLSYATYNTKEAKTYLGGKSTDGKWYWQTDVYLRNSDGYINTPDEVIAENDTIVVPVFIKEFFTGGLLGLKINESSSLELSMNYFNDVRGRGIKIYEEPGSNISRDTYQSYLKYKGSLNSWKTHATLYALTESYFRLNEYYSDGEYKLYEVDSKRNDYGLRLWGENSFKNKIALICGLEYKNGSVKASDIYYTSTDIISNTGTSDILALFTQLVYPISSAWSVTAGLRYDFSRFHDAAFLIEEPSYSIEYFTDFQFDNIESQSWSALNPKLIVQYSKSKTSRVFFTLSKGFRAPMLDDLCRSERSNRGLRIANPELNPEHIYSAEVGFDKTLFRNFSVEMSCYYTLGYDFMQLLSTGDSVDIGYTEIPVYHIANISMVNIYGLESDFSYVFNKNSGLSFNYTFISATIGKFESNTGADIDLSGKHLANIPLHRANLNTYFKNKLVNLSVSADFQGRRFIKDDNSVDNIYLLTNMYPSVLTLNAKIWKEYKSFVFSLDLDNVTNEIYINSKGYKSPGRMLFAKIAYNFTIK